MITKAYSIKKIVGIWKKASIFSNWIKDVYVKNRALQDIQIRPTINSIMAAKEDVSFDGFQTS